MVFKDMSPSFNVYSSFRISQYGLCAPLQVFHRQRNTHETICFFRLCVHHSKSIEFWIDIKENQSATWGSNYIVPDPFSIISIVTIKCLIKFPRDLYKSNICIECKITTKYILYIILFLNNLYCFDWSVMHSVFINNLFTFMLMILSSFSEARSVVSCIKGEQRWNYPFNGLPSRCNFMSFHKNTSAKSVFLPWLVDWHWLVF
jgi:hypothetical protein